MHPNCAVEMNCRMRFDADLAAQPPGEDGSRFTGWYMPDHVTADDQVRSDKAPLHDHVTSCSATGSPSSPYHVIGSATLPRKATFRNDSSYAAWYTDVECQPQIVEVLSNGYYVKWTFDGKVVGGNLDSRLAGVPITGNQIDRHIGRAEKHHQQPYAYSIPVGRSTYHGGIVLNIDPTLV